MPNFICTTCGTQYAETGDPPSACTICQEDRQYVKATGQQWTTLNRLRLTNRNSIKFQEAGLISIGIEPQFAIGQRALFVRTPKAKLFWTITRIRRVREAWPKLSEADQAATFIASFIFAAPMKVG